MDYNDITVEEYLLQFFEIYGKPSLKPTTLENYNITITKHLIPAFGKLKLQKLTSIHIETYKLEKLKNGRRDGKGGLFKRSVRYHLVIFNQAFKNY